MKNKPFAPFSNLVIPYFKSHPECYLDINCGPNAYRESLWDSYYPYDVPPSLCLLHMHDYLMYWWLVDGLTIVLNWSYEDTIRQVEFARHLTQTCGAKELCTLVDGVETLFKDVRRLAA